ncbi:uncharacterized protein RSE6_08472 [Rhynchosporium secalis]|uniref:Uncharacterized protein n=1 Tax=Rhynchosporium secalis TaxID=38038 RepID=A0A1E1MFL2_RHYSE|nr:uncharacterized protein RSE6_08472 [Rhynchosporium secalis]
MIRENSMIFFKHNFQETSAFKNPENLHGLIEKMHKNGVMKSSILVPSKCESFYYSHKPVYSGLESLKLSFGMENVVVGAANAFCAVSAVSPLYNALQQQNMLKGHWRDLDNIITANISEIFRGSLPVTAKQMVNRLYLCMKIPVAAFSETYRGAKPNFNHLIGRDSEETIQASSVSTHLSWYLQGEDSAERFV